MRLLRAPFVIVLALALGCASGLARIESKGITRAQLLAGRPLGVGQGTTTIAPEEVLAVTPEMQAFLDANVDRRGSDGLKVRQLAGAIMSPDAFGLQYDDRTRTASETFRARRGNCLSFSTLFVALAREIGLHVRYQEVDVPPDWTLDKDTFVLNRHVDVRVTLEPIGARVVDFNTADFRTSYDMRTISDARALAHYYNNVGVERMQAGDSAAALASFRTAISQSDEGFAPAWMNLGTLYLRHGDNFYAEAAYLQALHADPSNLVVMSNLAHLYATQGDPERAASYRRRVVRHRMRNPYYRFQLAREAFAAADYDTAIRHLKYALHTKKNEEWFYSLLGQCYREKGNHRAAERWLQRARTFGAPEASTRGGSPGDDAPTQP